MHAARGSRSRSGRCSVLNIGRSLSPSLNSSRSCPATHASNFRSLASAWRGGGSELCADVGGRRLTNRRCILVMTVYELACVRVIPPDRTQCLQDSEKVLTWPELRLRSRLKYGECSALHSCRAARPCLLHLWHTPTIRHGLLGSTYIPRLMFRTVMVGGCVADRVWGNRVIKAADLTS